MKRAIIRLSAVLLISSCASQPSPTDEAAQEIEAILSQPQEESAYGKTRRCLPTGLYTDVDIIDARRLIFRGLGGKAWLNQLRQGCIGMRPSDTLLFELRGNRACDMDTVSVIDHFLFWRRSGASCALGEFELISEEQAALIKGVLQRR